MRRQKKTPEERKLKPKENQEPDRPIRREDLDALLEHFGQNKNLPK